VLLVDDKEREACRIETFLTSHGFEVYRVASGEAAFNVLDGGPVEVLVTRVRGEHIDGLRLLELAKRRNPEICVVLLAEPGEVETATQAMSEGAYDFQTRPINLEKMVAVIRKALERQRLVAEVAELARRLDKKYGFHNILGNSAPMVQVFKKIMQIAPTRATVLIQGETGTGKDLVATAIHHNSPRRNAPFVKLNCAALDGSLVESELFGHERGAFPGAQQMRRGRFEIADGGTLFLDEVGAVSPSVQAKLLRVLEKQEFERLGGTQTLRVDVRLIASTNDDLREKVERGLFREDLFRRLNVVRIELPPLRQRRNDIPLLAHHFLEEANREFGRAVGGFTRRAMERLMQYHWPGNVRELKNLVFAIVRTKDRGLIDLDALPPEIRSAAPPLADIHLRVGMTLKEVERIVIQETLARHGWNRVETARVLGIGLRTLYRKIKEYGLRPGEEGSSRR
jgi:DNA-binding NtrC family response regulator